MNKIILLIIVLLLIGCKNKSKTETFDNDSKTVTQKSDDHKGKKILESECYICHNPKVPHERMIAPPMVAIKKHYIKKNTTKEEFTEDLIAWVNDPEQETKMPGAQRRFGKMPYIPYPDKEITLIAEYLYEYDIEKPDWFEAHSKEMYGKGKSTAELHQQYTEKGMAYMAKAKTALGNALTKAIQQEGPSSAVEFCNLEAIKLTDSISVMNNAAITRVSDKPRNKKNKANEAEIGFITYFKKLIAGGNKPEPIVNVKNGDEVQFYFPIVTNTMCLQCHGTPHKQIQPESLTVLKLLYPDDQAVGYKNKEVRGLWSINFDTDN